MENATKALIIAGEILIGVLILSLASYIVFQFGSFSRKLNEEMSEAQITEFNVHFSIYDKKAGISAQSIASLINFAKQHNQKYEAEPGDDYYVDIKVDNVSIMNTYADDVNKFLSDRLSTYYCCNLSNFRCTDLEEGKIKATANRIDNDIIYNKNTKLVTSINFRTITTTNNDYIKAFAKGYNIEIN